MKVITFLIKNPSFSGGIHSRLHLNLVPDSGPRFGFRSGWITCKRHTVRLTGSKPSVQCWTRDLFGSFRPRQETGLLPRGSSSRSVTSIAERKRTETHQKVAITNNELTTKSVPGHIVTTNNSHETRNSGAILTSDRRAHQVRARRGPA